MKAIICSVDGIPTQVAVVNDDEEGAQVQRNIAATKQYDRVDLVDTTPADDLQTHAFKAALGIAE